MQRQSTESGYSLLELLVAIAITIIVTGAIYGLLSGGQGAFRREPAVTDRQQNIRLAMDLIMRDITSAGVAMPIFVQTFTRSLNGVGVASPTGGVNTDDLEVLANPSSFDPEPVCGYNESGASHIRTVRANTQVQPTDVVLVFFPDGRWTLRRIESTFSNQGGPGTCQPATWHSDLSFRTGRQANDEINVPSGLCAGGSIGTSDDPGPCDPDQIGQGEVITYRIRTGSDGVPNLERRASGSYIGSFANAFQVVARGVEDMQVKYTRADGTLTDDAPQVVNNQYNTLITKVEITLGARALERKLTGATASAVGLAVRGNLTSAATMRAALHNLAAAPGPPGPRTWF